MMLAKLFSVIVFFDTGRSFSWHLRCVAITLSVLHIASLEQQQY